MSEPQPKRLTKISIILIIIAVVVAALAFSYAVITDVIVLRKTEDMNDSENAVSMLWVGSSHVFVGNVPQQLQVLSGANGIEIIYKDLSKHGNRGGTLSELSVEAITEMQDYRYDYIVLQDQTRRSLNNTEELLKEIRILCEAAREHGTIPVIYNSAWATANGRPDEARLRTSTEVSKRAAEENNAILVDAAGAWIYAYQELQDISLYTSFDLRGPHASKAGGFLTSCVFAAVLFDLHIEQIPEDSMYKGSDALTLAEAAWEFVTDK